MKKKTLQGFYKSLGKGIPAESKIEFTRAESAIEAMASTINSQHKKTSPLNEQIGGNHYKDMVIQPFEFAMLNQLNFAQASVIKYVCRYKKKNGLEDLKKAKHFIDLLIQFEYDKTETKS